MKVYMINPFRHLSDIPKLARMAERLSYDAIHNGERIHNAFVPATLAIEHTQRIGVGTNVAIAFARSPMVTAYVAWDLAQFSGGRFFLGLGSQVKGHVINRFGSEWGPPAKKMREYIQALRAIWDCWQNGTKLNFRGDFYKITLMTPYFNPGPIEHPNISVHVSAVGPRMARMAGEISDGVGWHRFHTAQYLKEVVIKNLHEGARAAGRDPASLRVSGTGFIVTGRTQEELERGRQVARGEIAFYGSTPAYHPVLELHGWQDIGHQLHQMSVSGQWREMSKVITEEMLDAFTITATYDKIIPKIRERYGSFATGINFSIPVKGPADEELLADMVKQLKA